MINPGARHIKSVDFIEAIIISLELDFNLKTLFLFASFSEILHIILTRLIQQGLKVRSIPTQGEVKRNPLYRT